MRFEYVSKNDVEVMTEDGETVESVAEKAITRAQQDFNVWNLFIVLPVIEWAKNRVELQHLGYIPAGNKSIDNKTFVKLKRSIRPSSDGGHLACDTDLAVPAPVLPKSGIEESAIAELLNRLEYQKFRDRF
jgi:hypothetical protein